MAETTTRVLIPESFQGGTYDIAGQIGLIWELIKAPLIVPLLRVCVYISLAMSLMLFFERLYMGIVIILVKLFWKKPEKRYKYEPIQEDLELGSSNFPVVLIQIPMFNEREVHAALLSKSLCFCFCVFLDFTSIVLCCYPFVREKALKVWCFLCVLMVFWVRSTRSLLVLHVGFHGRPIVL